MYTGRTLLRRITHQLIYIIIVASLVALSLKAISQEKVEYTDYHIYKAIKESTERHVIEEINQTPNFYKVTKKLRNDN